MASTVLSYPVPPYSNPPIEPQFYQPRRFVISNISTGITTTITTELDNDYSVGQLCRLLIPKGYGCIQINEMTGYVISIPASNQVVLDINSQKANAFISASLKQVPQIVAIGDVNTGQTNANGPMNVLTYILGSFINISPN